MWLNIHGRGVVVDAAIRGRAERRLGFALGRFGHQVGQVAVHLSDVNGPRGGVDKRCRVVVELLGHDPVVVEEADTDLDALVDRAADRVGRAVARRLVRTRLFSHPRA